LWYASTVDGEGRAPSGPGGVVSIVVIGAAVVVVAVLAAGTATLRSFHDGVADGGQLARRALIGALIGAAIGGLVVLGLRRLGPARTGVLGLASGAALGLLVLIAVSIGATAGVATTHIGPPRQTPQTLSPSDTTPVTATSDTIPGELGGPSSVPEWIANILAVLGVLLIIILVLGFARTFSLPHLNLRGGLRWGNRGQSVVVTEELDVEAAADSFDDSAASIGDDDDPRAAIIAAYARLLDGLAEAGCARLPYEAPEEHLRRSLVALGVTPQAMALVVDKFLVARFSTHPLTAVDRDDVRAALRAAGGQLREAIAAGHVAVAP
jgi:hypothetical protein